MKMRKDSKTKAAGDSSSRRGFALLITITLLAFLVLLLVSLASLTRVETQVASNNQKLAQARQNALMALNIAVGQLQKYAGPDSRVTGRSNITDLSGTATNGNITGVWSANSGDTTKEPIIWLASGNDNGTKTAGTFLPSIPDPSGTVTANDVFLVDSSVVTSTAEERKQRIRVTKEPIMAAAGTVPGLTTAATVGNYAYWVGDEGVKASVALPDRWSEVNYGPWSTDTVPARLRQQLGSAANYFKSGSAKPGFDPFNTANKDKIANVNSIKQVSFLTPVSGAALTSYSKEYFHDFTSGSYSVLANTLPAGDSNRGLLKDLSAKPELLGDSFKDYVNYASYMTTPTRPEDIRRYYTISEPKVGAVPSSDLPKFAVGAAPVLSEFMLRFRVSRYADNKITVRSKLYVSFWNPYTSALVPQDLILEITGLPTITMKDKENPALPSATVDLQGTNTMPVPLQMSGSPAMQVVLKFDAKGTAGGTTNGSVPDRANWLPGRSYTWSNAANMSSDPSDPAVGDTAAEKNLQFYNQNSDSAGDWIYRNVPQIVGGFAYSDPDHKASGILVSSTGEVNDFKVVVKNAAGAILQTCVAPRFSAISSGSTGNGWKFAYAFRLDQPSSGDTSRPWIRSDSDFRSAAPKPSSYIAFSPNGSYNPINPTDFSNIVSVSYPEFLVTRDLLVTAFNDASLFELPRQPLMSLGELQHLQVDGGSLFSIGNSWGGDIGTAHTNGNVVFDRFFFSGLTAGGWNPNLTAGQPLPNWNMRAVSATGAPDITAVRAAAELSSRNLLQGGGFNLNSTSISAWRAVLSRTRFNTTTPFSRITLLNSSGTQSGTATTEEKLDQDSTLGTGMAAPVFARFPQSAQEVYAIGTAPATSTRFDTTAFRYGIRGGTSDATDIRRLTTDQIETLATNIVTLIKTRGKTSGPFRTLSEFLNAAPAYSTSGPGGTTVTRSLLEKAIDDSGINHAEIAPLKELPAGQEKFPGFSSLTLTQADIMTALAPYLRTRSDTFIVRTYGDATNPVTGVVEGRAYAEALVQRFPEPADAAEAASLNSYAQPAGAFGRRFKIISFRWLTPSEI